jgi:hypothetical protein
MVGLQGVVCEQSQVHSTNELPAKAKLATTHGCDGPAWVGKLQSTTFDNFV